MELAQSQVLTFQRKVLKYYQAHQRSLPWRGTTNPYHILVSEVMLQQTQVNRVLTKYQQFLNEFPDINTLAAASLTQILRIWSGLGYNRRAKYLLESAQVIENKFKSKVPQTVVELVTLPGISDATAAAICAYAFNQPVVFVETNIRTVFLHEFFPGKIGITDQQIQPLLELTLDRNNPRQWYWALMDYGTHLKKTFGNPNSRSKQYVKQSKFTGSNRQIRGLILKTLLQNKALTNTQLARLLEKDLERINANLEQMEKEGLINNLNGRFVIKS